MIKKIEGEKWRQVVFDNWETMQRKYAISNMGRLASYSKRVLEDGLLLKGSDIEGYKVLRLRVNGSYVAFLFHRLVADSEVPEASLSPRRGQRLQSPIVPQLRSPEPGDDVPATA